MIHIKKLTILILIIIIGIITVFIFNHSEPAPELFVQTEEKEKENSQHNTGESEVEKEEEVVAVSEDPVKDFLSERLERVVAFFNQEINIVTLGDSLTEGIGDETNNRGYIGILDETINQEKQIVQFHNFAKRGSRSGQLLSRLADDEVVVAIENADIILITIGANDIMQVFKENITDLTIDKFTQEQIRYEQRLETIFSEIQTMNPHSVIYLIGFYNPFNEYFTDIEELEFIVNSWNQIGADVTKQYENTYYIPIKDLFEHTNVNYFSNDNFHPNYLGYRLIAERILQYVMNEGEHDDQTNNE